MSAEQLAPLPTAAQVEGVVDGVPGLVPQDAHARVVVAAFHFQHLRHLEPDQARVREVEGNGHAGNAVGGEPLVGEPEVRAEQQAAAGQLAVQLLDPQGEIRALDLQVELTELHVEQFLVAEGAEILGSEPAKRRPRHGP